MTIEERDNLVLDAIRQHPCATRAELVEVTKLSSRDVELATLQLHGASRLQECEAEGATYKIPTGTVSSAIRGKRR